MRGEGRLNLLLDTYFFIWAVSSPARMGEAARDAVASAENQVFVSSATVWEIAIKHAAGRLIFPFDRFDGLAVRMGFEVLPILSADAVVAGLCRDTMATRSAGC